MTNQMKLLFVLLAVLLYVYLFLPYRNIITSFPDIDAQISAMSNFKLELSQFPSVIRIDNVLYDSKVYQIWGLGTPFFLMIFKFLSLNSLAYIDIALSLHFFSILFLSYSVFRCTKSCRLIAAISIFIVGVTLQPLHSLLEGRFLVYELVVFFQVIYFILMLAFFLNLQKNQSLFRICIFVIFCQASIFIRPTLYLSGIGFILLSLYFSKLNFTKRLVIFFAFTLLALTLFFAFNFLRFGNPLEYGQTLAPTMTPWHDIVTKFYFSDSNRGFFQRIQELTSCMISQSLEFMSDCNLNKTTIGVREVYFDGYSVYSLIFFVLSLLISNIGLHFLFTTKKIADLDFKFLSSIVLLSGLGFVGIFVFHSYYFTFTSRYLFDFYPFVLLSYLVWILVIERVNFIRKFFAFVLVLIPALLSAYSYWSRDNGKKTFVYDNQNKQNAVFIEHYRKAEELFLSNYKNQTFSGRYCNGNGQDAPISNVDKVGWDSQSCKVNVSTNVVILTKQCYRIKIEVVNLNSGFDHSHLQLKMNGLMYEIKSVVNLGGSRKELNFCNDNVSNESNSFGMLYIAWQPDLEKLRDANEVLDIKLISVD